jgi:hypothetical protein
VAFGVNGLFLALAHFAVYDVAALACLAVSMWFVARASTSTLWVIGAAIAFAGAVIAKYGYTPMIVPLVGLLLSVRDIERSGRALALFLSMSSPGSISTPSGPTATASRSRWRTGWPERVARSSKCPSPSSIAGGGRRRCPSASWSRPCCS